MFWWGVKVNRSWDGNNVREVCWNRGFDGGCCDRFLWDNTRPRIVWRLSVAFLQSSDRRWSFSLSTLQFHLQRLKGI